MTDNGVFIFVSAGNCGGCERFKKNFWEKTKSELNKIAGLSIVEVPLNKIGDKLPPSAHPNLDKYIGWYPTFILVSKSSYDKKQLDGVVFNGIEGKHRYELSPIAQRRATDDINIVAWVKEELNNNPIFKKGIKFGSLGIKTLPVPTHKPNSHEDDASVPTSNQEFYTPAYCQRAFRPYS